jgi:hypothetical protein
MSWLFLDDEEDPAAALAEDAPPGRLATVRPLGVDEHAATAVPERHSRRRVQGPRRHRRRRV